MTNNLTSELRPAGTDLFSGFGSFIRDLSENDESMIAGGGGPKSNSKSGRRKKNYGRRKKNYGRGYNRSKSKT